MKTIKMKVNGMTCNHCEMTVTKALIDISGVKNAIVDRNDESAIVTYKSGKVLPEKLVEAVKAAGYEATIDQFEQ